MRHHTSLARMQRTIPAVVRVGRRVHKSVIELGLADVGLEAVHLFQSSG